MKEFHISLSRPAHHHNKSAFHLLELADRPVCKSNASFWRDGAAKSWKNIHSENDTRYFKEIWKTRIKLILQIGTFRLREYCTTKTKLSYKKAIKQEYLGNPWRREQQI